MDINFTANEAFELAQQIELRVEAFYLQAAAQTADAISRELFQGLAAMEHLHAQVFEAMQSVPESVTWRIPAFSGQREVEVDLWPALAGGMLENINVELPRFFAQRRTSEDILRGAMDFERDTLVFFYGIRQMMATPADQKRLDDIMKEEMGHLLTLGSQLARLGLA